MPPCYAFDIKILKPSIILNTSGEWQAGERLSWVYSNVNKLACLGKRYPLDVNILSATSRFF